MERMTVGQKFHEMIEITGRPGSAALLTIADALYNISPPDMEELSEAVRSVADAIEAVAFEIKEKL